MECPLCIHWLGNPSVTLNGKPVHFEMRKALALLAYLRREDQEVPREKLAALFWPEFDQTHALANLRRSLSSVGKSLPGAFLNINRNRISFPENNQVWEDVAVFHEHLAKFRRHEGPAGSICDECLLLLEEAVAVYQGDFLEGLNLADCPDFDEWQRIQRESLRQELAGGLQPLVTYFATLEQYEKAIGYARRWVGLDPLHEPAQRALITVLSQAGQRSAAIRQFEGLVDLLQKELQQAPEKETVALYQAIGKDRPIEIPPGTSAMDRRGIFTATNEPMLKGKLYIPAPKGKIAHRSRLNVRLKQIENQGLTILAAPAGFGKTTALADWIRQTDFPVGWVSLDNEDNHLKRFFSYLFAALESIDPDLSAGLGELLNLSDPVPPQVLLERLIHNIEESASPFALVLDDYQFITAQPVQDAMMFLLQHLPVKMHLVIATRRDPPLPLARMRLAGNINEIRASDLRFSLEEAGEFLNESMQLHLSQEGILTLAERTEGWIAGLQMAALSLRGRADPVQFIQSFSGSSRYILDYLIEEVLAHQPEAVQTFLLVTAVLDQMCADLADALGWQDENGKIAISAPEPSASENRGYDAPLKNSQQTLEYLERGNLFTVALDEEANWFRYHHLFAQLLRSRASQIFGVRGMQIFHQRAASWYSANGIVEKAIDHGLAAKDYSLVADLIQQNTQVMLAHGEYDTVLQWIDALPEAIIDSHPWLLVDQAWMLGILNQAQDVAACLRKLERLVGANLENDEFRKIRAYISYFRAMLSIREGNLKQALDYASQAQQRADVVGSDFRNHVMLQLGSIHLAIGNLAEASIAFAEVEKSLPTVRSLFALLSGFSATINLADIQVIQGDLRAAEETYQRACSTAAQWGDAKFHVLGRVYISLGDLFYEKNELARAVNFIQKGIDHYQKWGHASDMAYGYLALARALLASNNFVGAKEAMDKALSEANRPSSGAKPSHAVKRQQILKAMKNGDLGLAEQWLLEQGPNPEAPMTLNNEPSNILRARIWMMQKNNLAALNLLDRLAREAQTSGRNGSLIEIRVLQALALQEKDQTETALENLMEALHIAEPSGIMRVFLDEGEPLRLLLWKCKLREEGRLQQVSEDADHPLQSPFLLYLCRLLDGFYSSPTHLTSS